MRARTAVPADVHWMVLVHVLRVTGLGIAGGLLLSMAACETIARLSARPDPFDPVAFAAAGVAWLIVTILASCYPARPVPAATCGPR